MYYYGARWYDARLGRFVSADTIVPNPGNPQDLNRYAYVRNNPLKYVDPTGHALSTGDNSGGRDSNPPPLEKDCATNACRHPFIVAKITFYAYIYGIPRDLLGTTLMTEAIHDQQFPGEAADFVNRIGLNYIKMGSTILRSSARDTTPLGGAYLGAGMSILLAVDTAERWHGSPGIGAQNIHIDTVRSTENYFQEIYPGTTMARLVSPGRSTPAVLESLFSTDGNIRYAAAHLRQLADLRTSRTESHVGRLTDVDMAIIYGAYRSGIDRGYDGLRNYQSASIPGDMGKVFLVFLDRYRQGN